MVQSSQTNIVDKVRKKWRSRQDNLYVFCEANALVKSEDRNVTVHCPSTEVLVSNNCFHLFHLTFFHPELFNFFHSELNAFMSVFCSVLSPSTRSMFLHHFRFCIANFESVLDDLDDNIVRASPQIVIAQAGCQSPEIVSPKKNFTRASFKSSHLSFKSSHLSFKSSHPSF